MNAAIATQFSLINAAITTPGTALSNSGDANFQNVNWFNSAPTTRYYPAFRVDYNATEKFRFDFSFEDTKVSQPGAFSSFFPGPAFAYQKANNQYNNYIGSLGLSWTITPTLINQFRGGYYYNANRTAFGSQPSFGLFDAISNWASRRCVRAEHIPSSDQFVLPCFNALTVCLRLRGRHSTMFGMRYYREQDHYWNAPDGMPSLIWVLRGGIRPPISSTTP